MDAENLLIWIEKGVNRRQGLTASPYPSKNGDLELTKKKQATNFFGGTPPSCLILILSL